MTTETTSETGPTGITKNGLRSYAKSHRAIPLRTLRAAYARRRATVCAALGITEKAFNARAERAVASLLGWEGTWLDRVHAFSYVANRAEAGLATSAEAARVRAVRKAMDALAASVFRATHDADPYAADAAEREAALWSAGSTCTPA